MIKQIKIGQKDIHFARIGGKVIYPNYVARENLVLWYDFSGRTNLDVKKGIAEDLSGNENDGILENFAYESGSGYDSNSYLEFDNVDDFITIPELNLDVNDFTVLINGEILSYRGDDVAKMNRDGLEIGGRNLLLDSNILIMLPKNTGTASDNYNHTTKVFRKELEVGQNYSVSAKVDVTHGEADIITFAFKNPANVNKNAVYAPIVNGEIKFNLLPTDNLKSMLIYSGVSGATRGIGTSFREIKLKKDTIPTDWTPAPEDFQTTQITPIFSNKIKTLMYWNRALTDTELQEVYNVQKHRI